MLSVLFFHLVIHLVIHADLHITSDYTGYYGLSYVGYYHFVVYICTLY